MTGITNSAADATDPADIIVPGSTVYGPFGQVSASLGNGLSTNNTYDKLGNPNGGFVCQGSISPSCAGGTQVYGYLTNWTGPYSNGECDTVLNICQHFYHDEFGRLSSNNITQGSGSNYAYSYDRWGNRWSQSGGTSNYSATYSTTNQMTEAGVMYDAAGNMTKDPNGTSPQHTYTYDAEGNLTGVDGGSTATYTYDALNHRTEIAPTRGTYDFVFDIFGRKVSTWSASGHFAVIENIYTDSGPIAFRNGSTNFEHLNWIGTERLRTTYTGSTETSFTSLPWGDDLMPNGDNGDQYDFASLDRDLEDNTEHAQFRNYSVNQGRWLTPDPYLGSYDATNPQSFNRYNYALNNPVSLIDPSGLDGEPCGGGDPGSGGGIGGDPGDGSDGGTAAFRHAHANDDPCGGGSGPPESNPCLDADPGGCSQTNPPTSPDPDPGPDSPDPFSPTPVVAPNNVSAIPTPSVNACKAAAVAAGAAGGALAGGAAGGVVGGVAGGAGGTLVAPGVGTVGGGIVGAEGGATAGAWLGGLIGGGIGYVVGNVVCSSGTGGGGGSNTPQDRCTQVKQGAIESCSEQFVGRGHGSDAPALLRACVRQIMASAGCPNF